MVKMKVLDNFNTSTTMAYNLGKRAQDYGTFHLTATLIKRVRALIDGAPALIEIDSSDPIKTAFEEFASGKLNITDDVLTKE